MMCAACERSLIKFIMISLICSINHFIFALSILLEIQAYSINYLFSTDVWNFMAICCPVLFTFRNLFCICASLREWPYDSSSSGHLYSYPHLAIIITSFSHAITWTSHSNHPVRTLMRALSGRLLCMSNWFHQFIMSMMLNDDVYQ